MSEDKNPPNAPTPRRVSRWPPPPGSRNNPYRFVFRLVGIPLIAVAAVLLYRGLHARFFLPECDSDTAKQTLAQGLEELKLEPTQYAPIKTVSTSKTEVVCNAVMPLPGGGDVGAECSLYWQGSKAKRGYTVCT